MNYVESINRLDAGSLKPILVLSGEERYLIDYFIGVVKTTYLKGAFKDLNYDKLDLSDFNFVKLVEACETISFDGSKRVIEVRGVDFSKASYNQSKDFLEKVGEYSKSLGDELVVLFISESGKVFKSSFTKKYQESIDFIEMEKLNYGQLGGFIKKKLAGNGKNISSDMLSHLIESTSYLKKELDKNLMELDKGLDKLISYMADRKEVTREDIDQSFETEDIANIFALTDAILEKNHKKAFEKYYILNSMEKNNYMIFHMILRLVRNMYNIKILQDKRKSANEIASSLKLNKYELGKLLPYTKKTSYSWIKSSYKKLYETEINFKNSRGTFEENMAMLLASMM